MKKVILIIALLVPIGIFIFLKMFGKNEFSIPVYYETGVENPPANCKREYQAPYLVPAAVLNNVDWNGRPVLIVIDSSRSVQSSLTGLDEDLAAEVQTIFLSGKDEYLVELYACDLLLKEPWTTVLVDDQRRIRGYYDPETREEVDRLIVELKILLKKY
jgi:hypothetical protein